MKKSRKTPRRKVKGKGRTPRRYRRSTRYRAMQEGTCVISGGVITWTLPRKIRSLNVLRNKLAFWADGKAWESQFAKAKIMATDGSLGPCSKQRLKLTVQRLAPSRAFFLDKTNLAGGIKGLEDVLVRLEYLVDDCEEWEDGPYVSQGISPDKKYWAVITLETLPLGQTTP